MTTALTTTPPPPPLPAGRRNAVRVLLVVVAGTLVTGCVLMLGVAAWRVSTLRMTTDTQTLPAAMKVLTIDTANSPVTVRIVADADADVPRADLRAVHPGGADERGLVVTNDVGGTRIGLASTPPAFMGWSRAGQLTVTLPPDLARELAVITKQEIGDLEFRADVATLDVSTTHGDVTLSGAARRVEVHTQKGDVTATRNPIRVTEAFSADTRNGDFDVEFAVAPRTIDVITRNGDIALALPEPGPYTVHAQSGGDVDTRVSETSDPGLAVARVTVRSDYGDVVIDDLRRVRPALP
jgi:hypothetical protein